MKITTPNVTLEGDSIEAILEQYGLDCLCSADLRGADLRGASLSHIDLRGADLWSANLSYANLSYANLSDANLNRADLNGADLRGVNLSGADLSYADLSHANHVKLSLAKISILPDEGDIIGWKKAWTGDIPAHTSHREAAYPSRRATLQRHRTQMPRQHSASARPARQARQQPPTGYHGVQRTRHRLHVQKRRNHPRRRLRYQPVERMRPRHPLLHHPHRSSRILGGSK